MKLTDLDPKLNGPDEQGCYRLVFDCPCGFNGKCEHIAGIKIGPTQASVPPIWSFTGVFPDTISTQPSIMIYKSNNCNGWHGYLTNGEMISC